MTLTGILSYLAVINLTGFAAFGIDKYKAIHHKWRIRESALFAIAILGGSVGCLIGMHVISSQNPASFFPDRDSYDSYCGTDRRMCVFLYHQQPYTIPAGSCQSSSSRTFLSVPPEKIRHCKNT